MEETIKIGKWNVPKKLYDEYIKWRMYADGYLNKTIKTPAEEMGIDSPAIDMERNQRWLICAGKVIETHKKICEVIGIEYTESENNEFYMAFHKKVREDTKLKG